MAKTPPPLPPAVADALDELNEVEAAFLLAYQGNGFNGAAAYRATHPDCKTDGSAAVGAHRMLSNAKVRAALRQVRNALLAEHGMDAEEATALVAMRARMDVAGCYDADGKLLPPNKWPAHLRHSVKGWKGDGSLTLVDPQRATETILQMLGKLKNTIDLNHFDHSGYLAEAERLWEEKHGKGNSTPQAQPQGRDRQRGGEAPASARDAHGQGRPQAAGADRRAQPRARVAGGRRRQPAKPAAARVVAAQVRARKAR